MAIMAMAMAKKINNLKLIGFTTLLQSFIATPALIAGEWQFTPKLKLEEIFTDNVELTITQPTSSLVSQINTGLDVNYQSRFANFSFSGGGHNLFFSHDNKINDSYLTLDTQAQYSFWSSGPIFKASASIKNTNKNSANNSLATLVSGDTIQSKNASAGLSYNIYNSAFSMYSDINYNISRFEDGIGEYNDITASINLSSNNNPHIIFSRLAGNFSTKEQDTSESSRTAKQYQIDAMVGLVTSFNFSPFIRFHDEDFSGDLVNQSQQTTSSWGPGFRWLISEHLKIDLSYNYVADDTTSDDYISATMEWEPSARTSLAAGYSQRFFGDSYNLNLQHKTKRLTNSITYVEALQVFDRNNYEQINLGIFWCPTAIEIEDIRKCFIQYGQSSSDDFQLVNFFSLEPIESNEFSLNRNFTWNSKLQLARTAFIISTTASRREGLESAIVNDTLGASFTISREISARSKLALLIKYDYKVFDKDNSEETGQKDHYRTISTTYTKNLASSLSANLTVQHVNRDSSEDLFSYDEMRTIINITKEF